MLQIVVSSVTLTMIWHLHVFYNILNLLLTRYKHFCFQVFRKFGVEKFDPTNEPFDPHMHNAVFQVADNSKPPGTVAHVLKVLFSNPFVYRLL